jgi:hypothetical protein
MNSLLMTEWNYGIYVTKHLHHMSRGGGRGRRVEEEEINCPSHNIGPY